MTTFEFNNYTVSVKGFGITVEFNVDSEFYNRIVESTTMSDSAEEVGEAFLKMFYKTDSKIEMVKYHQLASIGANSTEYEMSSHDLSNIGTFIKNLRSNVGNYRASIGVPPIVCVHRNKRKYNRIFYVVDC